MFSCSMEAATSMAIGNKFSISEEEKMLGSKSSILEVSVDSGTFSGTR